MAFNISFIPFIIANAGKCNITEALIPVPTLVGQEVKYPSFSLKA